MAAKPKMTLLAMAAYLKDLQHKLVGFNRTSPHLYKDLVRSIDSKLKEIDAELLLDPTVDNQQEFVHVQEVQTKDEAKKEEGIKEPNPDGANERPAPKSSGLKSVMPRPTGGSAPKLKL